MLPLVFSLRFPRTAVTLVALLWFCTALLMLVGVGELGSRGATEAGRRPAALGVCCTRRRPLSVAEEEGAEALEALPLLRPWSAGVLKGVNTLTQDACLFGESFVLSFARKHTADKVWGPSVCRPAGRQPGWP